MEGVYLYREAWILREVCRVERGRLSVCQAARWTSLMTTQYVINYVTKQHSFPLSHDLQPAIFLVETEFWTDGFLSPPPPPTQLCRIKEILFGVQSWWRIMFWNRISCNFWLPAVQFLQKNVVECFLFSLHFAMYVS